MAHPELDSESRALVNRYLSRRGLLGGAAATTAAAGLGFGFFKTKEIEAYNQQTDRTLYNQLGGLVGISLVITDAVNNVANDTRINSFFAGTVANNRIARLEELLVEQIAAASGGPVTYLGLDMKSAHAGLNITQAAFNAFVEDLVASLQKFGVIADAQMALLNALAPLAGDIVTA